MVTVSHLTDSFIQAKMHRERRNGGHPRLVVLHDMEAPETATIAEDLGKNWFANPINDGKLVYASTQYGVDSNSIAGYVSETRASYGATSVSNDNGIHIEHAGYARQSREEWQDPYGLAMLDRSSRLTAEICDRYKIPIKFLDATDLRAGKIDGITTHAMCTEAWGGNHTDPGPGFPMAWYINQVKLWHNDPNRMPVLSIGDFDGKNSLGEHDLRPDKEDGVVTDFQNMLISAGYELPIHGADGDFGNETATATSKANQELLGISSAYATRQLRVKLEVLAKKDDDDTEDLGPSWTEEAEEAPRETRAPVEVWARQIRKYANKIIDTFEEA